MSDKKSYQIGDSIPIAIDWQENSSGSWQNITLVGTAGAAMNNPLNQTVTIEKICTDDTTETLAESGGVEQINLDMFKSESTSTPFRSELTIQGIDDVGHYKAVCVYDSTATTDEDIEPLKKTVIVRFQIIDEA